MKNLLVFFFGLMTSFPSFALTEARYQMTQDQNEVLFINTVAENPNIEIILKTLEAAGYAEFDNLPDSATNDIWCRVESKYQSPILWVECYETHPGLGVSFHDDYDAAQLGYDDLPKFIETIRQTTRRLATTR